jgi:hypoxanthine phosphoribosyltransferase
MEQNFNKRFITWRDVDDAVERLAINITNNKIEIAAVGGLPRGGLIPAVMLSHKMSIPFVSQANIAGIDGNILIVDDICDSGKTLKRFKFEENVYTATLHYKSTAEYEPHFWWRLAPINEWIVYPWEREDSKTIADYAAKGK